MTLDAISAFLDSSPTIRLLKADLGAYVVFFLRQSFKANHEDSAIAFSHDDLIHRLQCFEDELHDELHDEDRSALVGSADRYLRE
ncbi:MAG: hypothetical protein WBD31_17570 [Rubripirellula sp.]